MTESDVTLRMVDGDRSAFMPLLLEADEVESVVRTYLNDGKLCELLASGSSVGVVLLIVAGLAAIEIKNIAIRREHRRQPNGSPPTLGRKESSASSWEPRTRATSSCAKLDSTPCAGWVASYRMAPSLPDGPTQPCRLEKR